MFQGPISDSWCVFPVWSLRLVNFLFTGRYLISRIILIRDFENPGVGVMRPVIFGQPRAGPSLPRLPTNHFC